MNKILVNTPFTVTIKKVSKSYNAICLSDSNGTGTDKNIIKNTDNGEIFTVEDNWFDEKLTGRKITYYKQSEINF